jgi:hypothetical protein
MRHGLSSLLILLVICHAFPNPARIRGEGRFLNSGIAFGPILGLESGSDRSGRVPTHPNGGMGLELMRKSLVVGPAR